MAGRKKQANDILTIMKEDKVLSRIASHLEPLQRPCIRIHAEPASDEAIPKGVSKFGGHPDLPESFSWPLVTFKMQSWLAPSAIKTKLSEIPLPDDATIALPFIAQFKLSELAAYDVEKLLPSQGLLFFFYNTVAYQLGLGDAQSPVCQVLYIKDESVKTHRTAPPRPIPPEGCYNPCQLTFSTDVSLPNLEACWVSIKENMYGFDLAEVERKAYVSLRKRLNQKQASHRLLGHPEDEYADVTPTGFRLLLQVDQEANNRLTLGQKTFVFIRESDLLAQNFSNVCAAMQ